MILGVEKGWKGNRLVESRWKRIQVWEKYRLVEKNGSTDYLRRGGREYRLGEKGVRRWMCMDIQRGQNHKTRLTESTYRS